MPEEGSQLKLFLLTVLLVVVVTALSLSPILSPLETEQTQMLPLKPAKHVKVVVLFDDHPYNEQLKPAHGFSCFIIVDNCTVLFDAGGDPAVLLKNAEVLKVNFSNVRVVFISHDHSDHIAGLQAVLPRLKNVVSFVPQGSMPELIELLSSKGKVFTVLEPTIIGPSMASTGVFPCIVAEHALLIKSSRGIIMVVGCSHPGILEMVKRAIAITQSRIHLIIGGMYLPGWHEVSLRALAEELKSLGVEYVAPVHCCSEEVIAALREVFGEHCLNAGVGFSYEVNALRGGIVS